jgi:hypothetical protein
VKTRWKSSLALCAWVAIGPLSVALADGGPPAATADSAAVTDPYPLVEELLLGSGSRGPYALGWNHVVFGSEAVEVDGKRVQQGLDYSFDYAAGRLQFIRPLGPAQVARIRYRWDRAHSRPGSGGTRLPVALKLWQGGAGSAQVSGLMAPSAGVRQYNLKLSYDPSRWLSFRSKVERVDALADAQRGQERILESHEIAVTPASSSRLTLSRDVRGKARTDGGRDQIATTRAQLEQRLGSATAATALVERSQPTGTPGAPRLDRTALTLTTRPFDRAQIAGSFTRSALSQSGADTTTALSLTTTPLERWKLNSQFSQRHSERDGASSMFGMDWNGRAGKWFGLEGGLSRQEAQRNGTDEGQRLRLSLGPVSLEGRRSVSDRLANPDEELASLRLDAAMLRGLRLGGGHGSRVAGLDRATTEISDAFVELAPDKAFRLRGSVESAVTGEAEAVTTALSAAFKAPGRLEVTGAYKTRGSTAGDALISRDYAVALTPFRGLKLQGAYQENPEDPNGRVLDRLQTSLGLQSQVGSVGLSGMYTTTDGSRDNASSMEQMELKLTLNLAPTTRFYSGYRDRAMRQEALLRDRTFSLGFTRSVGSSLFLLLEGEYTLSERDGQPLDDPADARANARLGLRF